MKPTAREWTVPEVELALLGLKKITVPEFEILSSFEVPPKVVLLVIEAVRVLLGAEDLSWRAARHDLLQEKTPMAGSTNPSEEFSKLLANTAPIDKFRKEYPKPTRPKKHAILVKQILEYSGYGKDPKKVTESIEKYLAHPEFSPENAGLTSRAARALCVWVQAIDMNFQEQRKKPPRHQIEKAILKGQKSVASVYNMQVNKLLPKICQITGKQLASKEYDDLQASTHYIMRRIFKDKHREARKAISSTSEETSTPETYERDVDLRASNDAFRRRLEDRVHAPDAVQQLQKRAEPRLVSLCKFNDRAFQSEAAGLRSWERFHNIDPKTVSFQDAEPRPCTVERRVRRAEELDRMYKSDILIKQLLKALESPSPEQDTIKRLVSAGANLDYVDDKGRTVMDIIRDKKLFVSLHILDRIVQEKKGTTMVAPGDGAGDKAKKKSQPVRLPAIQLPRPRSFQQKHRAPLAVTTYRKFVAPTWQPKYHLSDPNEVLTDSDVEEEEEEEEIDPAERKRENILRYSNVFCPPLTPPNALGIKADDQQDPMEQPEEPALPEGAAEEVEEAPEETPPEDEEPDASFFLTDGSRLALLPPEDAELPLGAASPPPASVRVRSEAEGSTGSRQHLEAQSMLEEYERLQRESVEKKKGLFDIYKGGTERGGIDDPSSSSSAHDYLRLCEQLGLLPRPLAFGRPNQKDLNLQGFGLHPRHAQALALSIRGLENCTSLNLQENKLGEEGLASLSKALVENTSIVSLNLSYNRIRTSSQHIVDLLAGNTALKHLDLEGNEIPDKHLARIVASVCDPDVRDSLNIAGNTAGRHTAPLLVKLIESHKIRSLNLCWMGLGKKFVDAASQELAKNLHLKVLKLAWNGFCDESMEMLSRCFAEAASTGKMQLEVLDLAHNRIRERGAAMLAMTMERYGPKMTIQSISLDGNAIGDVGFRACVASMAVSNVSWGLWNCSPEVRASPQLELFEADRMWREYELDLSDWYQHLVAWKVARLSCPSATTPEGARWCDPKIDGVAMEQPDPDWDPPESGVLEFSIQGPVREMSCKMVFEGDNYTVVVPMDEDAVPDSLVGTVRIRKESDGLDADDEDGEEDAAPAGVQMRVVKYAKQDLFTAAYDYERQLSDPVGGVNQFIAERLSPDVKPGAFLYVDQAKIEVTEARTDKNEFSVRGLSESLQTALTEGRRQELEFRHSFLLLAPIPAEEPPPSEAPNEEEAGSSEEDGEEEKEPAVDDGMRRCLYEARLPRATVDGVHLERIMRMLSSFARALGEEGTMHCLRSLSKDLYFSVRQAERIADTFVFVPAKRLLPVLLSPSDASATLHKLDKKTKIVMGVGREFSSVHRPWVDHETANLLDEHLVHQQHTVEHTTESEAFVDMLGGKFQAVRKGDALPAEAEMPRSVLFKLADEGDWDEPMGHLSKVMLLLPDKRVELAVLDDDHQRRTLRLGEAPLSISAAGGGVELAEMGTATAMKLSTMTKEEQAYEFEYAEFGAKPASQLPSPGLPPEERS